MYSDPVVFVPDDIFSAFSCPQYRRRHGRRFTGTEHARPYITVVYQARAAIAILPNGVPCQKSYVGALDYRVRCHFPTVVGQTFVLGR